MSCSPQIFHHIAPQSQVVKSIARSLTSSCHRIKLQTNPSLILLFHVPFIEWGNLVKLLNTSRSRLNLAYVVHIHLYNSTTLTVWRASCLCRRPRILRESSSSTRSVDRSVGDTHVTRCELAWFQVADEILSPRRCAHRLVSRHCGGYLPVIYYEDNEKLTQRQDHFRKKGSRALSTPAGFLKRVVTSPLQCDEQRITVLQPMV